MDQFKQAVNLARGAIPLAPSADQSPLGDQNHRIDAGGSLHEARIKNLPLKAAHLETRRIVSHNKDDLRARSFDMLRTQVLQRARSHGLTTLGVLSAANGEGKTLTAVNLALSLAAEPNQTVLLLDLDLRRPAIARTLGTVPVADRA